MQLTNRTTHFYCEVVLRNEKLQLSSNQVQNLLFLERLLPNKTTIRKNVKKYERDGPSFNMNKERSGRTIKVIMRGARVFVSGLCISATIEDS